jgi:alpha-glucosidase
LSPRLDRPDVQVVRQTPAASPWRVIQISREPAKLIESPVVLALNPESRIADTSWIKPGKTSWTWWSGDMAKNVDFKPGMNTPTLRHYIDFSAELGLEYALIDEGWSTNDSRGQGDLRQIKPEIDLPALLAHAKDKGVRVWLWAHWDAVDRYMEEVFSNFEKWGVAGVKIDFMDRDDQWMVGFYHRAAETAAKHRLMVDFHGAYKPTGLSRTYPNVMTYEGGLSLEYLKWSNRTTAEHNTIIPFTRMLAGPLDYTPGGMSNVRPSEFRPRRVEPLVPHTRAHQLALFAIFESAFQMLADHPEAYRGAKELEYLKSVPAAWDETRGVAGYPGRYVVVARRKGDTWWVGAITNGEARQVPIDLDFLPGDGSWVAETWADGTEPTETVMMKRGVDRSSKLVAAMAESGGFAARIRPAR